MPPEPEGPAPYYEIKEGKVFIEGTDVTDVLRPGESDEEPEGTEAPSAPVDPVVEGEEAEAPEEVKEKAEAEPVKTKPEEAVEGSEEPEGPAEPDKWKFKLKFRGKEEEVEWDRDSVQHRLSKLRAFEENEKEFWEKRREVEPYWNVVKSDWFKERLKEGYESGELDKPPTPPEAPAAVKYEILKRQADPDYDEVLSALQTYALSLPPQAMQLLDGDPNVFLSEYDRIATERRGEKASTKAKETTEAPGKLTPEETKKKLALKESAKTRAKVTVPGTPPEPVSELRRWENRKRELERAMRDPSKGHLNLDLTAQLLMHLDTRPQT